MSTHGLFSRNTDDNLSHEPPNQFKHLTDSEKIYLLRNQGCLHGFDISKNDGPKRVTREVAKYRAENQHYSLGWLQERQERISETITTKTVRESNYVHRGWSLSASDTILPWSASRIARHHQACREGAWTTKFLTFQRLHVEIPLEDLVPVPEFKEAVQSALEELDLFERFLRLDRVFDCWGEVVPVVYDLGASMAITDEDSGILQSYGVNPNLKLGDIATYKAARVSIQGGDTDTTPDNVTSWLSQDVHHSRWSQARVIQVIPTTYLLDQEMQERIECLYSKLISYSPLSLEYGDAKRFDGRHHALKTIEGVTIHTGSHVDSLYVIYLDGTQSELSGGLSGKKQIFSLRTDEYITGVLTWSDDEGVCAIQLSTSKGRISPHYGGFGGRPMLLGCEGGALVAFSGGVQKHSEWKMDIICRIQTIWRHDSLSTSLVPGQQCSQYFGGVGGEPFNDWSFLKNSNSAYVSSLRIRSGTYVHSIQATYTGGNDGTGFVSPSWPHGGSGGLEQTFSLEPGECIVVVSGAHDSRITQLRFVTNYGRVSPKYGRGGGQTFECKAALDADETPIGLRFIIGKSSKWLDGLAFVWARVFP